jgi:hypothetical protein
VRSASLGCSAEAWSCAGLLDGDLVGECVVKRPWVYFGYLVPGYPPRTFTQIDPQHTDHPYYSYELLTKLEGAYVVHKTISSILHFTSLVFFLEHLEELFIIILRREKRSNEDLHKNRQKSS